MKEDTVARRVVAVEASAIRYDNELTFRLPPEPLPSITVWQFAAR